MASLAAIAAAIAAVAATANDGARTLDHEPIPPRRQSGDWAAFVRTYTIDLAGRSVLRATVVAYRGEVREDRTMALGATVVLRRTRWAVQHLEAWGTDTEPAFRDRLEAIASALDAVRSLGATVIDHDPCTVVVEPDGLFLGDTLCHVGELRFEARHEETLVTA